MVSQGVCHGPTFDGHSYAVPIRLIVECAARAEVRVRRILV
jgi:hypothetical protein